jgi:hypothetical protein
MISARCARDNQTIEAPENPGRFNVSGWLEHAGFSGAEILDYRSHAWVIAALNVMRLKWPPTSIELFGGLEAD